MSALVEEGPAGRAVQMDDRERRERNTHVDLDVVDLWFWHPADIVRSFTVSVSTMTADEEAPPGVGSYLLAILEGGRESVGFVAGIGLPAEMGLSVAGMIRLPDTITTPDGARRVVRGLMRALAAGTIPADPVPRANGMVWTAAVGALCEPLGGQLVMRTE